MEPVDYHIPHLGIDLHDPQAVLRKYLGDKLIITNLKSDPLLSKNRNVTSVVKLELTIKKNQDAHEEQLHLVAKISKSDPKRNQTVDIRIAFQKEIYAYEELIPMYENLQRNAGLKEDSLVPKIYGTRLTLERDGLEMDDECLIILDNLLPQGYKVLDLRTGIDLIHSRFIVAKLAKFHALGVVCKHRYPEFFESTLPLIQKNLFKDPNIDIYCFYKTAEEDLMTIPGLRPYEDRIKKALPLGRWTKVRCSPRGKWSTIIHGDLWISNILLHYNLNNDLDDLKFIDLQTICYDICFKDLLYFIFCNCSPQVITNHFEELIDNYYQCFIKILQEMNLDDEDYNRINFNQELDSVAKELLLPTVRFLKIASHRTCRDMDRSVLYEMINKLVTHSGYEERVFPVVKKFIDNDWI